MDDSCRQLETAASRGFEEFCGMPVLALPEESLQRLKTSLLSDFVIFRGFQLQAEELKALAENEPEKAMLEGIATDLEVPIESHPHSSSTFSILLPLHILSALE